MHGYWRFGVHARLHRHVGGRRDCTRALPLREWDELVLILDLVHRIVIGLATGVGPSAHRDEARIHFDFFQAGGQRAFEVRAGEREFSALVPMRAQARRSRYIVPRVDNLHDPPALALHRRHHQHDRLGGEVEVGQRIERVHIHPDDFVVRGIWKFAVVIELIERRATGFGFRHVRLRVRLRGDVNQRRAKHKTLLRNGSGFGGSETGGFLLRERGDSKNRSQPEG